MRILRSLCATIAAPLVRLGAFIQLAPHAATDITAYASIGNLDVVSGFPNGTGLLQLDASGRIDVKANTGACIVTLYTYGYVF